MLGANRSFAGNSSNGAKVFAANCVRCHAGGGNVIAPHRSLTLNALEYYLDNFTSDREYAVRYQVTYGSGAMFPFGSKLSEKRSPMWRPTWSSRPKRAGTEIPLPLPILATPRIVPPAPVGGFFLRTRQDQEPRRRSASTAR